MNDLDDLPKINQMLPTWVAVEIPPGKRAVARVTGEDPRRSVVVRFIDLDELPADGETVLGFISEPRVRSR